MDRLARAASDNRAFAAGLALVAVYAVLRTLGAPEILVLGWTAVAALATVASPLCGLTVLAALGPFTEALTDDGRVTAVPYLLGALGLSVVIRVALTRPLPRPSLPIALAIVLFVGTAAGVGVSAVFHGAQMGVFAAQMWVPGIGGALTVLFAAAWLAARGEMRPLAVAVASVATGAMVSITNEMSAGAVDRSAIG